MTSQSVAEAQAWLRSAVAFWTEHGLDHERGGFHEHLTHQDLVCTANFRRLRVLTRQIYVFSSHIGHDVAGAREALGMGLDFLLGRARRPDGGYATRFDLDGRVIDDTRDLYDLAFVLFALCHAYRRLGDIALRDEARNLLGFIAERMSHPAGGYLEALPPRQPRRQNSHMHLLEAAIAWSQSDPAGPFGAVRDRLLDLFEARFFDREAQIVREYVADDLTPLSGLEGETWEPGHHFEWVWLLDAAAVSGARRLDEAAALMHRARTDGLHDGPGRVYGGLDASGAVLSPGARIWTLTEWLKAEVVTPGADREARVSHAWSCLRRYLDAPTQGLWFERWDPQAGFVADPAPATSLYHISMAVEVMSRGG